MEDKKAAKKIIKRAKKHPDWYTAEDVRFAKMVRNASRQKKKQKRRQQNMISEATQHDWEDFWYSLRNLAHGTSLILRKFGKKWMKLNH